MSTHDATCVYCEQPMVLLDCAYPFWYHAYEETPRHGDWVPDHGCVADFSAASAADLVVDCDE